MSVFILHCDVMCAVHLQIPAVFALLHGGGALYGVHALSAERQRALQDLHHREFLHGSRAFSDFFLATKSLFFDLNVFVLLIMYSGLKKTSSVIG